MLNALEARGISTVDLLRDLDLHADELRLRGGYVPWDDFARLLDRAADLCGGSERLESVGGTHLDSDCFVFIRRIARLFVSARDLYWIGSTWFGPNLFSILIDRFTELPNGELRLTLEIPPPYRDCPAFFWLLRGALRAGPRLLGPHEALVELEIRPRCATYRIFPPKAHTLFSRLRGAMLPKRAVRETIRELSSQQMQLRRGFVELREATARIARQASQLEELNHLSRELAKQIDLDALARAIVAQLETLLDCHVGLWLGDPPSRDLQLLWATSDRGAAAAEFHEFSTPGGLRGRLGVWSDGSTPSHALQENILKVLLPWIAIALDNAHAYAVIRRDAIRLRNEIAERKRAENFRRQLEARLLQKQKLESLGLMAGGIAHDFNNLLTGILGNADTLARELEPGSRAQEIAATIDAASQRAADLVADLLAYTGRTPFRFETVDLVDLIRSDEKLLRSSIPDRFEIRFEHELAHLRIEGDASQMRRVVANLLINAAEAMADGSGPIVIRTGVFAADRDYLDQCRVVANVKPGLYAFLEVEDRGCGVDSETMERIFDPFFSTKVGGQGLGLACVVGIARSHGGAVHVSSAVDHGSAFRVFFPILRPLD